MTRLALRVLACMLLCLMGGGCTPRFGLTVTNAPTVSDCIPGSATKPCP